MVTVKEIPQAAACVSVRLVPPLPQVTSPCLLDISYVGMIHTIGVRNCHKLGLSLSLC